MSRAERLLARVATGMAGQTEFEELGWVLDRLVFDGEYCRHCGQNKAQGHRQDCLVLEVLG